MALNVNFPENKTNYVILFLVGDVNITYSVDGLEQAFKNISTNNKLACSVNSDLLQVDGLLRVDSIQLLETFSVIPCLGGEAIKLKCGIVPFGNVDSFLSKHQLFIKY